MRKVWSPAYSPDIAPQQVPPAAGRFELYGNGDTDRAHGGLWVPSEGPYRSDPGGPGGEPNGRTIPIPGRTALNER